MFQAVHRIVRGANDLDLEFLQYGLRGQFGGGQFFVRLFPDFVGGFFVEQLGNAEITLQFQMRPVIERIAERVRHGGRPGFELVKWTGAARAKTFRDAVGAHGAPFVMVAFQPDFKKVFELAVGGDVARRNVAMVVKNRLVLGVLVVKFAGRFGAQQKIFVDEWHGCVRLKVGGWKRGRTPSGRPSPSNLFAQQQRFHVPLEQVLGDVFGDDGLMFLERVEIAVAFLGGDFETDVDQLPEA